MCVVRQTFYKSCLSAFCCFVFFVLTGCVTYTNEDKPYISGYDHETSTQIYLDMGLLRLLQQNTDEAEHYLLKAYKLDEHRLGTVEALALLYQLKRNYGASARWFNKALAINQTNGRINFNYGVLLFQQKHYSQAIKTFTVATKDDTYRNKAEAWENIARCYRELGDAKLAQNALDKAGRIRNRKENGSQIEI